MQELTSPKNAKEPSTLPNSPDYIETENNKTKEVFEKTHQKRRSKSMMDGQTKYKVKKPKLNKTFQNGWEATQVLKKHTGNPRYLGFSPYLSQNVLQNSSYMYSFPKGNRFRNTKKDNTSTFYNLPSLKMTRFTTQGYGNRSGLISIYGKGCPSPDRYHLKTSVDYNLNHKKGALLLERYLQHAQDNSRNPGPGTYNLSKAFLKINMPIKLKSRQCMFYDDDLKKKAHCVSMEKYHPKFSLTEPSRFGKITFGIGERKDPPDSRAKYPGPGAYHVKSCFETGYKKKWVIN